MGIDIPADCRIETVIENHDWLSANTDGLRLLITSETTGSLGTIKVFGGAAHVANQTLDEITNATDGTIVNETSSLESRIKNIQDIIDKQQEQNASSAARLRSVTARR